MSELTKQLRIKAGMINLGERIEWGSETALMETAANRIDHLEAELAKLRAGQEPVGKIGASHGHKERFPIWNTSDGSEPPVGTQLYTAPQPRAVWVVHGLDADGVRAAFRNAIEVFAEEQHAQLCREVAEYMRDVLLVDLERAAPSAPATVQGVNTQLLAEYHDEMANGEKMANCNTDCRSTEGVTVGLIDGLITIARVLTLRDLSPAAVQEALIDLRSDEDLSRVLNPATVRSVNTQLLEALESLEEAARQVMAGEMAPSSIMVERMKARAAPRQPERDAHKHEAQPEVAQNTGSRSMTNKLSSQGCTGCTGVEGVAAPCETPDAVDIFAWATFDGEGSYDLRLYEDNEGYRDDFRDANPLLHPDWVFPLCRLSDAQRAIAELREECEHLKDCQENAMLHMTGLVSERDTLRQQLAELRAQLLAIASAEPRRHTIEWAKAMAATGNNEAYAKWREAFDQRDRLAELLREAGAWIHGVSYRYAARHPLLERIDAALAEVKP